MYKLVFDTETTGLPTTKGFNNYFHPQELKYYDSSRIVQIAYIILDQYGNEVKKYSTIIKPDNFTIKNHHIHNIPQEKAEKEGINFKDMISIFYEDLKSCDTIIAHNLNFDRNILLSECYRYSLEQIIKELESKIQFCTMIEGRNKIGGYKYPKLVELYSMLYNIEWNQVHDALDDCIKCKECYIGLI